LGRKNHPQKPLCEYNIHQHPPGALAGMGTDQIPCAETAKEGGGTGERIMKGTSSQVRVCVLIVAALAFSAQATTVYEAVKPKDKYGTVTQLDPRITSIYGNCACGPTATINSFVYLMNMYDADGLIDDYDGDGWVTEDDWVDAVIEMAGEDYMNLFKKAENFDDENENGKWDPGEAYDDRNGNGVWDDDEFDDRDGDGHADNAEPFKDWGVDGIKNTNDPGEGNDQYDLGEPYTDTDVDGHRDAYERRVCDGCLDPDMVVGKGRWIDEYNESSRVDIVMKGQDDKGAGGLEKTPPTWRFLYNELKRCEDVEVGFGWAGGGGHWVTAHDFKFTDDDDDGIIDAGESATLSFRDPWGAVDLEGTLKMDGGFLKLTYTGGPEPLTMLATLLGVGSLGGYLRRRRGAAQHPPV